MKRTIKTLAGTVILCLLFNVCAKGALRTWNSSVAGNWGTAGNWLPVGIPVATDDIIFPSTATGTCTITSAVSVNTITLQAGCGTVIQANGTANTITVADSILVQGGTFTGGNAAIYLNSTTSGSLYVEGGTFNSTDDTVFVYGQNFYVLGGTFNAETGKVDIIRTVTGTPPTTNAVTLTGNPTFYKLDFRGTLGAPGSPALFYIPNAYAPTVSDTFFLDGSGYVQMDSGAINVHGDLFDYNSNNNNIENLFGSNVGTTFLIFNGPAGTTQIIQGPPEGSDFGPLPCIEINKASADTLRIIDTITVSGYYWTYMSGTINCPGMVYFLGLNQISGSHTLSHVEFSHHIDSITPGTILTIDSSMVIGPNPKIFNGGNIYMTKQSYVKSVVSYDPYQGGGGSTYLWMNGTGTQEMIGNSQLGSGLLPNVIIAKKKTDSLIIISTNPIPVSTSSPNTSIYLPMGGDTWTYDSCGPITGDGIVDFDINLVQTIIGSHTLPNVLFDANANIGNVYQKIIRTGDTLTVSGTVITYGDGSLQVDSGFVNIGQHLVVANTGYGIGGNATFNFTGDSTAYFDCNGTNYGLVDTSPYITAGPLCNIKISKSTGSTLYSKDSITINGNWDYVSGTVDYNTDHSLRLFTSKTPDEPTPLHINGTGLGGTMAFDSITLADKTERLVTGNFDVANRLNLDSGFLYLNGNTVWLLNQGTNAVTRTSGSIVAETDSPANLSYLQWSIGSALAGTRYVFPFATSIADGSTYLPFVFTVQTAGAAGGSIAVSTYATEWTVSPNNRPFPNETGVTINNINNLLGLDNSSKVLDRYWVTSAVGYGATPPIAHFTLAYRDSEWRYLTNNIKEYRMLPIHWDAGTTQWTQPTSLYSTIDTANDTLLVTNVDTFASYTLVDPEALNFVISAFDTPVCLGACVRFQDDHAIPRPVTYHWYFPGGTPDYSTDSAPSCIVYNTVGAYNVTVTGIYSTGDSITTAFTDFINVRSGPTVTKDSSNVLCNGAANGVAKICATGGTAPYAYAWSVTPNYSTASCDSIKGLAPGTYYSTLTDENGLGCVVIDTFTITQPNALTASITASTNISCFGGATGTATVTPTGGTSPYTYKWSTTPTAQTTAMATALTAGPYTVTVTDANLCTTTASVTLTQPAAALSATAVQDSAKCNGGATGCIVVTASGGTPAYQYAENVGAYQTSDSLCGLAAGSYTVTVEDSKGCTTTVTKTVLQPAAIVLTLVQDSVLCNGGSTGKIIAKASGGTSPYTFSGPNLPVVTATADTFDGLTAGTYAITVTDAKGCTAIQSITVLQPAQLKDTATQDSVYCYGASTGCIIAVATGGSGGYMYTDGITGYQTSGTFCGLSAANNPYSIEVKDYHGCLASYSINILQAPQFSFTLSTDSVKCNGGITGCVIVDNPAGGTPPYEFSKNGGTSYQVNDSFCGLPAGIYTITGEDVHGCTATFTNTIYQPAVLTSSIGSVVNDLCKGNCDGKATVTVTGGTPVYDYSWSAGSTNTIAEPTDTDLCAGQAKVTVTDVHGCTTLDSVTITQPTNGVSVTVSSQTNEPCYGDSSGSATVSATGGTGTYTYQWSCSPSTTATASGLKAGICTVTVSDANGCSNTATITITQPTAPLSATLTIDSVPCNGGTGCIIVNATGGTGVDSFSINGGSTYQLSNSFCGLSVGAHTIWVKDANGCTFVISGTVYQPAALTLSLSQDSVTCSGTGTGCVIATSSGGSGLDSFSINNGTSYQFSNSFCGLAAGPYTVTAKDAHGCTATASATILQPPALAASVTSTVEVLCFGQLTGSITVTASGGSQGYSHHWSNGTVTTGAVGTLSNLVAGDYVDTVKDYHLCTVLVYDTITQPAAALGLILSQDSATCYQANTGCVIAIASGGTGADSFKIVPGGGTYQFSDSFCGLSAGSYTVTVKDANGCTISATISVLQPAALSVSLTADSVLCYGGSTGTILAVASGGSGVDSFSLDASPTYVSQGTNTYTFTGLDAFDHTVQVKDAHGCTAINNVNVYQPNPLTLTLVADSVICNGQSTGKIIATATGGSGVDSFYYNVPPFSDSGTIVGIDTFHNLPATPLDSVVVKDAHGCLAKAYDSIGQAGPFTITLVADSASCFGECNGEIIVTVSGGAGTDSFSINGGKFQSSNTFTGLCAGIYTVTAKDGHNCSALGVDTVFQPTALAYTFSDSVNVTCHGLCNGSLGVAVTGGTPPYSYKWNDPGNQTTDTATALCAGNYTVTITDGNSCTLVANGTISQPLALTTSQQNITDVSCNGLCNGSAIFTITGGTAPYTYAWDSATTLIVGNTTDSIFDKCAGTYYLTVTDGQGCQIIDTAPITQPSTLTATITYSRNVTCFDSTNGEIIVTASGGTPNDIGGILSYIYNWNYAANPSDTAKNLLAGDYEVTVTDKNGCIAEAFDTLTSPTKLVVVTDTIINIPCHGECNGSAGLSVSGGTPFSFGYNYNWDTIPNQNTDSAINLCAGTYYVSVTDSNSCTTVDPVTITQPPVLSDSVKLIKPISCYGMCNATLEDSGIGGTPPYSVLWNNNFGTPGVEDSNLCAGVYYVTLTDANNCSVRDSFTIISPNQLTNTITKIIEPTCYDTLNGAIDGVAQGGTMPYTFFWSHEPFQNKDTLTGLAGNSTYNVTVTDARGCSVVDSNILVGSPAPLGDSIISLTNVTCYGLKNGVVIDSATGGTPPFYYFWSDNPLIPTLTAGRDTASGLPDGTYQVYLSDANLCRDTISVTVTQPPKLAGWISSQINDSCFGNCNGIAVVADSGGTPYTQGAPYTYSWDTMGITSDSATGLCAGTYQVYVSDSNLCVDTVTVTITQPKVISFTTYPVNISCNGAADGTDSVGNIAGGNGIYTITWSTGTVGGVNGNKTTGLDTGLVSVTVTDGNGCSMTATDTITQPDTIALTIDSSDVSCYGGNNGKAWVTATGGTPPYHETWSGGTPSGDSAINLIAGTYYVTLTDAHGCFAVDSTTITQPATPLADTVSTTNVTCFGETNGTAFDGVSGGTPPYTIDWSGGFPVGNGDSAGGFAAGTYEATTTDSNGCMIVDTFTITQPPQLVLTIALDSNTNCSSPTGIITVSLAGGTSPYTYVWSNGDSTLASPDTTNTDNDLAVGSYTVTVTDSLGCNKEISANIAQKASPQLVSDTIIPTTCNLNNGAINLTFSTYNPPINYAWSPTGSGSSTGGLTTGTYTITINDATGCDTVLSLMVPTIAKLVVDTSFYTNAYCGHNNGTITLEVSSGSPPYTYGWSNNAPDLPTADSLSPGSYSVTVSDTNNCDTVLSYYLIDLPAPVIAISPDTAVTIGKGATVALEVNVVSSPDSVNWAWSPPTGLSCDSCANPNASPQQTTTYIVYGTDTVTNCADSMYVTIIVKDAANLFVPNAITPNGDGVNDYWVIRQLDNFPDNEVIVINRWGNEVFRASPYLNNWGGTYGGKPLPDATYYYIIKLNDPSNESLTGTLTIIK